MKKHKSLLFYFGCLIMFVLSITITTFFVHTTIRIVQDVLDAYNSYYPKNIDIHFADAHQALVFWKTDDETNGYLLYGDSVWNIKTRVDPTTNEKTNVHVVVLKEIPWEGVYVRLYVNDKTNWFFMPMLVKYNNGL